MLPNWYVSYVVADYYKCQSMICLSNTLLLTIIAHLPIRLLAGPPYTGTLVRPNIQNSSSIRDLYATEIAVCRKASQKVWAHCGHCT